MSDGCISQSIESLAKEYDEVLCNAPWHNEEISIQKRKRRRLEHKWRSTGFKIDRVNYLEQGNVVNDMLYKAKELDYSAVI